jgi:hypothetical protein
MDTMAGNKQVLMPQLLSFREETYGIPSTLRPVILGSILVILGLQMATK